MQQVHPGVVDLGPVADSTAPEAGVHFHPTVEDHARKNITPKHNNPKPCGLSTPATARATSIISAVTVEPTAIQICFCTGRPAVNSWFILVSLICQALNPQWKACCLSAAHFGLCACIVAKGEHSNGAPHCFSVCRPSPLSYRSVIQRIRMSGSVHLC